MRVQTRSRQCLRRLFRTLSIVHSSLETGLTRSQTSHVESSTEFVVLYAAQRDARRRCPRRSTCSAPVLAARSPRTTPRTALLSRRQKRALRIRETRLFILIKSFYLDKKRENPKVVMTCSFQESFFFSNERFVNQPPPRASCEKSQTSLFRAYENERRRVGA